MNEPTPVVQSIIVRAFHACVIGLIILFGAARAASAQPLPSPTAIQSAQNSLTFLRQLMDEYHTRFPVYDDISSPGNHFHAWARMSAPNAAVEMNGTWTDRPHSGATSIRCVLSQGPWGGFYLLNGRLDDDMRAPEANWGTVPNAGFDLTGATSLTFWARGAKGGEQVEFFVGGVGRDAVSGMPTKPFPESSPRWPRQGTIFLLSTDWQQFTIDLTRMNLSYVLGGLGWVADSGHNPGGAEFFLDDIQFNLNESRKTKRLNEPRFLKSFSLLPLQPDPFDSQPDGDIDFVLRNLAFTYDNALAILAFLSDATPDSMRRARLIGDAFVYAMQHDRTYNDNRTCSQPIDPLSRDGARLRTAYSAGDLALPPAWTPNGRLGTVPIPGFYAEKTHLFYEVEQQAVDTGNNLWALIALGALYQATSQPSYLDAACKIGNFVHALRGRAPFQGFTGGVDAPEITPLLRSWGSTEHQIDANAAFTTLYNLTGDSRWKDDAARARVFVKAMWDASRGCYLAGTTDPDTRNVTPGQLPVDVQLWSLLSLPASEVHVSALDCAEANHSTTSDGFAGVDFNEDRDGVWFEGTAQLALAEARQNRWPTAERIRSELQRAQRTAPFGNQFGIAASSHDGLSTGFLTAGGTPFKYFRRLHVGASAWNVFAQLNRNPYYSRTLTIGIGGSGAVAVSQVGQCTSTCKSGWIDGTPVTLTATPSAGWTLGAWTGACAGARTQCTVAMTDTQMVSITFVRPAAPAGQHQQ